MYFGLWNLAFRKHCHQQLFKCRWVEQNSSSKMNNSGLSPLLPVAGKWAALQALRWLLNERIKFSWPFPTWQLESRFTQEGFNQPGLTKMLGSMCHFCLCMTSWINFWQLEPSPHTAVTAHPPGKFGSIGAAELPKGCSCRCAVSIGPCPEAIAGMFSVFLLLCCLLCLC